MSTRTCIQFTSAIFCKPGFLFLQFNTWNQKHPISLGKVSLLNLSGQKHRGVYDQCRTWPAAQRYPSCRAGSFHFNSRCLEFLEFEGQFVKEIVFERIGSDKKQNICFPQLRPGLALGATEAVVWYRFPKQTG
jgi:hypothetical protein